MCNIILLTYFILNVEENKLYIDLEYSKEIFKTLTISFKIKIYKSKFGFYTKC